LWWLVGLPALACLLLALYIWAMLSWSYSKGERAGWIQKLSKKGYLCKTWKARCDGSLPGSVPEKFTFTGLDDQIAEEINKLLEGGWLSTTRSTSGLPTSCFGETGHFAKSIS